MKTRKPLRRRPTYEAVPRILQRMQWAALRAQTKGCWGYIGEMVAVVTYCNVLDWSRVESRHALKVRAALLEVKRLFQRDPDMPGVADLVLRRLKDSTDREPVIPAILRLLTRYYSRMRSRDDSERIACAGRISCLCELLQEIRMDPEEDIRVRIQLERLLSQKRRTGMEATLRKTARTTCYR